MFTSKELNVLICIAEEKSVTKAAERLNITAPAVSCMLRKLEDRLNLNLFTYSKLSMALTDCGQAIYDSVSIHYHALNDIEKSLMGDGSTHIMMYLDNDFYFLECTIRNFLSSVGYTATITNKRKETITYDIEICKTSEKSHFNKIIFEFALLSNGDSANILVMDKSITKASYFDLIEKRLNSIAVKKHLYTNDINEQLEMLNSGISYLLIPLTGVIAQLATKSFKKTNLIKVEGEIRLHNKNDMPENIYNNFLSILNEAHHSHL